MPAAFPPPLFGTPPGWVGAVGFDQSLPVQITLGGGTAYDAPVLDPARFFAVITQASFAGESGMSVQHSLNDAVRVYLFGERAHPVRVGGLAFPALCGPWAGAGVTGAERVLWFYENARASQFLYPVRIAFGAYGVFYGMVRAATIEWSDTVYGVSQFAFELVAFPRIIPRVRFPATYVLTEPPRQIFPATGKTLPWPEVDTSGDTGGGGDFGPGGDTGGEFGGGGGGDF